MSQFVRRFFTRRFAGPGAGGSDIPSNAVVTFGNQATVGFNNQYIVTF